MEIDDVNEATAKRQAECGQFLYRSAAVTVVWHHDRLGRWHRVTEVVRKHHPQAATIAHLLTSRVHDIFASVTIIRTSAARIGRTSAGVPRIVRVMAISRARSVACVRLGQANAFRCDTCEHVCRDQRQYGSLAQHVAETLSLDEYASAELIVRTSTGLVPPRMRRRGP